MVPLTSRTRCTDALPCCCRVWHKRLATRRTNPALCLSLRCVLSLTSSVRAMAFSIRWTQYGGVVSGFRSGVRERTMVRIWAGSRDPRNNDFPSRARLVFVGDGWGGEQMTTGQASGKVRVRGWSYNAVASRPADAAVVNVEVRVCWYGGGKSTNPAHTRAMVRCWMWRSHRWSVPSPPPCSKLH